MLRVWHHLKPKKTFENVYACQKLKTQQVTAYPISKVQTIELNLSQSSDPSEIKIFSKWELLPFKNLKWWKLLPAKICHRGGNSQMSKFKMLQTFTCVPKFEGLQTENFSNLRTSTVCRTHIGQKKWKGFYIKRVLLVDKLVNST